jgi:alpha-tubulin suppressor-like RCC1 family protein
MFGLVVLVVAAVALPGGGATASVRDASGGAAIATAAATAVKHASRFSVAGALKGDVRAISAGWGYTCALTKEGGLKCWGSLKLQPPSRVPLDVVGLERGIKAVSVGVSHACAVTIRGAAKCWGDNTDGQLGNGSERDSSFPVAVRGLSRGVKAIAAADVHTCAIVAKGALKCWGQQTEGELGNGSYSTKNKLTPVAVRGLSSGVQAVAVGNRSTCAITVRGAVKCWGVATLGNGSAAQRASNTPVGVVGFSSGAKGITVGWNHACAITGAGAVKCWGHSDRGQLGNGALGAAAAPVDVEGLSSGVSAIAAGSSYISDQTCAVTRGGGVKCWGDEAGGAGGRDYNTSPLDVAGLLSGIRAIDAGNHYTCVVTIEDFAKCWVRYPPVDVTPWQSVTFRLSTSAGAIARGTAVTFTATVSPPLPGGRPATVRFEVYHQVGSAWRLVSTRDVTASVTGKAALTWTFSSPGSWYVRARALATATYTVSSWTPNIRYTVN